MSGGKFASLSADLLVRKGDARPSTILPLVGYPGLAPPPHRPARPQSFGVVVQMTPSAASSSPSVSDACEIIDEPAKDKCAIAPAPAKPGDDKARRLVVTLTPAEHETLGLVAVKKSVTRHQLLRNAVDEYLALLVEEYDRCQCIYSGCSCDKLD